MDERAPGSSLTRVAALAEGAPRCLSKGIRLGKVPKWSEYGKFIFRLL